MLRDVAGGVVEVRRPRLERRILVRRLVVDLPAELLEARLERGDDRLEVDDHCVLREVRGLPAVLPGELGHRGALVLGDVAEAEGELTRLAEPLRPHLVGADARRDREQVVLQRLLDDRSGQIDVASREDDVRVFADQLVGARLGRRRVVALRLARLDHDLPPVYTRLVDLGDLELRRRERRRVERLHRTLVVERPPDHDRRLRRCRVCASRRGRGEDECRSGNDHERPTRPLAYPHVSPLRSTAVAVTLLFDQQLKNASRPRRASSAASRSQSESGYALPKAPLSEKISRS